MKQSISAQSQLGHNYGFVIQELVRLVDEIRPFNNSSRQHALYEKACALLNKLDEWNLIPRLEQKAPEGWNNQDE